MSCHVRCSMGLQKSCHIRVEQVSTPIFLNTSKHKLEMPSGVSYLFTIRKSCRHSPDVLRTLVKLFKTKTIIHCRGLSSSSFIFSLSLSWQHFYERNKGLALEESKMGLVFQMDMLLFSLFYVM